MLADTLSSLAAFAAPLLLLSVGLAPSRWANAHPQAMARLSGTAAWLALGCAILAASAFVAEGGQNYSWVLASVALPGDMGSFAIGTYINSLTAIMLILVSFVGAIVTRYARNYLDGDAKRGYFNKWLALTLASILTLIVSGNLLMFALAWIATSLSLHQLLMFYKDRPMAVLSAHKKFIASRIGELSVLGAVALIGSTLHTLQFDELMHQLAALEGDLPISLEIAALLIVLSAGLKSAQFPFHGWLLQVMEAPTPVSALLHAGIVNAGLFLVIRMSPVVSHSALAMGILALVGLITLALASLVMLTQTSVKVSLAWSTIAQMGFMLLEAGLGLYTLAMLHLVAHSLYKAHAFLASGSTVDSFRAPSVAHSQSEGATGQLLLALFSGIAISLLVGSAFGLNLVEQPAMFAIASVVAIALSQLLLSSASYLSGRYLLVSGLGLGALVSVAYFSLHWVFDILLHGAFLQPQYRVGTFQFALTLSVVVVFLGLLFMQQKLKKNPAAFGTALYMHLYNGLYIDVFITRLTQAIWPSPTPKPEKEPAPFAPVPSTGPSA